MSCLRVCNSTKGSKLHSYSCQARNQVGAEGDGVSPNFELQILNR